MSTKWPKVRLGEVMRQRKEFVSIDDLATYKRPRVKLHVQGIVLRDEIPGALIKNKQQQVCRSGEFLVAEIDAKVGGFGIVPDSLDGAIVSSHYFLFVVNEEVLDRRFLDWYIHTPQFRCQVEAQGSTNYAAIRPSDVLNYEIPLPPMAEQQRIVAKIDQIAAKIAEARGLCDQTIAETEFLTRSVFNSAFQSRTDWKCAEVGDLCEPPQYGFTESAITDPIGPRFLRITDIQGGSVNWDSVPYCDCPDPTKYLLQPDDILFARTGATTGKSFLIAECSTAVFASYLIRLRVRKQVTPEYLYIFFQSPQYWNQIADQKKGTGQPNLNGSKLSHLRIPVPPLHEQSHIVSWLKILQAKVNVLRGLQGQATAELDALLPSILDKAFKGEL